MSPALAEQQISLIALLGLPPIETAPAVEVELKEQVRGMAEDLGKVVLTGERTVTLGAPEPGETRVMHHPIDIRLSISGTPRMSGKKLEGILAELAGRFEVRHSGVSCWDVTVVAGDWTPERICEEIKAAGFPSALLLDTPVRKPKSRKAAQTDARPTVVRIRNKSGRIWVQVSRSDEGALVTGTADGRKTRSFVRFTAETDLVPHDPGVRYEWALERLGGGHDPNVRRVWAELLVDALGRLLGLPGAPMQIPSEDRPERKPVLEAARELLAVDPDLALKRVNGTQVQVEHPFGWVLATRRIGGGWHTEMITRYCFWLASYVGKLLAGKPMPRPEQGQPLSTLCLLVRLQDMTAQELGRVRTELLVKERREAGRATPREHYLKAIRSDLETIGAMLQLAPKQDPITRFGLCFPNGMGPHELQRHLEPILGHHDFRVITLGPGAYEIVTEHGRHEPQAVCMALKKVGVTALYKPDSYREEPQEPKGPGEDPEPGDRVRRLRILCWDKTTTEEQITAVLGASIGGHQLIPQQGADRIYIAEFDDPADPGEVLRLLRDNGFDIETEPVKEGDGADVEPRMWRGWKRKLVTLQALQWKEHEVPAEDRELVKAELCDCGLGLKAVGLKRRGQRFYELFGICQECGRYRGFESAAAAAAREVEANAG